MTVRPITLKKKKRKKKATKHPCLATRTKKLSVESHALAKKQPLLVSHHPTDCKVNKAENKVGEYGDDEEDEIKLAECGRVEAEVREGKVDVRYVKDEPQW